MKIKNHFLTLVVVGCASIASAKGLDALKGNGAYGTAGCGLGSMVFGNEQGVMQIVAATLNSSGVQTFGMTTGTSNCGPSVFAKAEVRRFIVSNELPLENDIARGNGETLGTLSHLLGCKEDFRSVLQQNYKNIYTDGATTDAVAEKIINLSRTCKG